MTIDYQVFTLKIRLNIRPRSYKNNKLIYNVVGRKYKDMGSNIRL